MLFHLALVPGVFDLIIILLPTVPIHLRFLLYIWRPSLLAGSEPRPIDSSKYTCIDPFSEKPTTLF
jgi:hypothetical protein